MPQGELIGKTAIVTGGGSGLGREVALAYAREGAALVVSSNVPEQIERVARECREEGAQAIAVEADVADEEEVRALARRCLDEYGRIDVLVNAAGVDVLDVASPEDRHVRNLSLEQWSRVLAVNLAGVFLCSRAAIGPMAGAEGGSIVNFSSGTVRFPSPGLAPYVASKFGVEGLTKVLAQELEPQGIRVNCLQPGGPTDTALLPAWFGPEERADFHRPLVIRACAVYLASDESRLVTGRSLVASEWNKERGIALCPCRKCTTRDARLAVEWRGVTAL